MGRLAKALLALGLWLNLAHPPALAGDAPPPEARATIERQLDAFARDDAEAAYALAAPGIKQMFGDSGVFMTMVRTQYAPVYRHRSVEFGAAVVEADDVAQAVTFVDPDNQVWTAFYKLARQPDGTWLISGCSLAKSTDASL